MVLMRLGLFFAWGPPLSPRPRCPRQAPARCYLLSHVDVRPQIENKRLCFFDSAPRRKAVSAITGMCRVNGSALKRSSRSAVPRPGLVNGSHFGTASRSDVADRPRAGLPATLRSQQFYRSELPNSK